MQIKISTTAYRWLFWIALLSVTALSLLPLPGGQLFTWEDKVKHCFAYGTLFFLAAQSYRLQMPLHYLALLLVLFGILMELAQSLTGYRFLDAWDVLANSVGVALVWIVFHRMQERP